MKRHFRNFLLTVAFISFSWMASAQVFVEVGVPTLGRAKTNKGYRQIGQLISYGKRYNQTTLTFFYAQLPQYSTDYRYGGAYIGRLINLNSKESWQLELNLGYLYFHEKNEQAFPLYLHNYNVGFVKVSVKYNYLKHWCGRVGVSRGLGYEYPINRNPFNPNPKLFFPHTPEITIGYRFGG